MHQHSVATALDADLKKAKATVDATIDRIVSLAKTLRLDEHPLKTTAVNIEPRYDLDNQARLGGASVGYGSGAAKFLPGTIYVTAEVSVSFSIEDGLEEH